MQMDTKVNANIFISIHNLYMLWDKLSVEMQTVKFL